MAEAPPREGAEKEDVPDSLQQMLQNLGRLQTFFQDYEKLVADAQLAERNQTPDLEEKRAKAEERRKFLEETKCPEFQYILNMDGFLKRTRETLDLGKDNAIVDKIVMKQRELDKQYRRLMNQPRTKKLVSPSKLAPKISGCNVTEKEEEEKDDDDDDEEKKDEESEGKQGEGAAQSTDL